MKIRADVAELLRAGASDTEVARRLGCCPSVPRRARLGLRLPAPHRGGSVALPLEEALAARTTPAAGGHLDWTGLRNQHGVPMFRGASVYRTLFRLQHGREPVGNARPGCEHAGCVERSHLEDRPMRQRLDGQLIGIFGAKAFA